MVEAGRTYRAGHTVEDLCRACKTSREHTIMAVSPDGAILRVVCGYCGSQHNYRGGGPVPSSSAVAGGFSHTTTSVDPLPMQPFGSVTVTS